MKTPLNFLLLSMLLLVLPARCAWGVEVPTGAPIHVGDLGDPARVAIEGMQTFTQDDIRRALQADLDYLVAAHPEATLAECLAALEDRVRAGYRDCGFPDVAVQARFDVSAGRIVAKVIEGPRFRCGDLRVTGLKALPITDSEFIRRFAEKLSPASDQATPTPGIWKNGMPVSFSPKSLANYTTAASDTFAALGRFAPTFKVEIQPQPASGKAVLAVIVDDEGPMSILQDIEVVGNKKNRSDAVIGFLGLIKGRQVNLDMIEEKVRALTQAARFADSSITPTVLGPDGQVSLRIKVVESGHLPPLTQPLSREEKALLRLREWLMAWESRQDDLILDWSLPTGQGKPQQIEVIVAPSGGIVARVMGNSPGQEKLQDLYSMVVTMEALALFAEVHERKLRIPLPTGHSGVIFVTLGPCTDCPSGFNLNLGAGLSPGQTKTSWKLRLDLTPAAFTDLLYRPGTKATWQDDVLTVRTEDLVVRVEEGTGRLLELGSISKTTSGAGAPDAIRFTAGAFAQAADQIATSASKHADAFQSQRALGSALGFIASELTLAKPVWASTQGSPSAEPQAALASALEKLLASSFLDPMQPLLAEAKSLGRDHEFTIPSKSMENKDAARQMFERVAVWCAGHAQELAPAGSWLQTLLRESAFTLNSRAEHTSAAIARLAASESLGPIGCSLGLHALLRLNQDSWTTFRDLGSRRLTTGDFRRDYRMLLDPGSAMTHCLANLARELGTLTPPEVEAIAGLLPPDSAALVREVASATRKVKDFPVTDAIGPALDRWWEATARGEVEAGFRFHAQPPAPATSGHQPDAAPGRFYFPAGIVAVVNERPILDSEIREKMSPTVETLRRQYTNEPALFSQKMQQQQQEVLENLINDELILAEAKAAGRQVSEQHLDQYLRDFMQKNYDGDSNVFLKTLTAHGTTVEAFRERHRQSDLVGAARREKIENLEPPTPEQIEQYYQSHEQDFRAEENVKLGMIVLNKNPTNGPAPVESQRKNADAMRARLVAGADFAAEAKLHSQGTQAQQGGDWGWLERNVLRKELDGVAFSLKPGELSDVIETKEACYIMRVVDRRPATLKPLAEVREEIEKTLQAQDRSAALKHWLDELRADAFVRYFGGVAANSVSSETRVVKIEIKHVGVSTISDALIRSRLRVKAGDPVTQASVDQDIRSLYGTGDFYNIRVAVADSDGGITLTYFIQERPVLDGIQFAGNKALGSAELLRKLTSRTGERLDEWKLFNDALTIQSLYQRAEFPTASVKYVLSINEQTGRGSVTFEITQTP